MTKLEIPEGLSACKWQIENQGCDWTFVKSSTGKEIFRAEHYGDSDHIRLIHGAALAPAMAEEIKRLREECEESSAYTQKIAEQLAAADNEITSLRSTIRSLKSGTPLTRSLIAAGNQSAMIINGKCDDKTSKWFADEAVDAADSLLAALAKPQGAQEPERAELPSGCEPFDLARAKVEGARDKDGNLWNWDGGIRFKDGWKFKSDHDFWFFNEQGIATSETEGRVFKVIFCIAKPVTRRSFDLKAALRGEKVVTRDGEVGSLEKYDYTDTTGFPVCIMLPSGFNWFTREGQHVDSRDKDLFMEGGV